jgi:RimJ/RimL family protein N-acetyltransferase
MLHEWLGRPHVAEWWGRSLSLDDMRAHYLPRTAEGSAVRPYIAYDAGRAIGFIQSYIAASVGDGWWPNEIDPGVVGIDQFLADATLLNQGRGTAMVRAFMAFLFRDPAVTRIQTDPKPTNVRAIRCYEKAGFHRAHEVDTPDGRALLMVCDRTPLWRGGVGAPGCGMTNACSSQPIYCARAVRAVPDSAGASMRLFLSSVPHQLIEFSLDDSRVVLIEFSTGVNGITVRDTFDAESADAAGQQRQGWQAIVSTFARHVETSRQIVWVVKGA